MMRIAFSTQLNCLCDNESERNGKAREDKRNANSGERGCSRRMEWKNDDGKKIKLSGGVLIFEQRWPICTSYSICSHLFNSNNNSSTNPDQKRTLRIQYQRVME